MTKRETEQLVEDVYESIIRTIGAAQSRNGSVSNLARGMESEAKIIRDAYKEVDGAEAKNIYRAKMYGILSAIKRYELAQSDDWKTR